MKSAYFITATGTDLGKTWLTAGVAAACRARGVAVQALKPVMSGYDPARHEESDIAKIGADRTLITVSPWTYAAALSPDRAAALEGKAIDFAALVGWCLHNGINRIDCQQNTRHLASLGAREIARSEFVQPLGALTNLASPKWDFAPVYWQQLIALKSALRDT